MALERVVGDLLDDCAGRHGPEREAEAFRKLKLIVEAVNERWVVLKEAARKRGTDFTALHTFDSKLNAWLGEVMAAIRQDQDDERDNWSRREDYLEERIRALVGPKKRLSAEEKGSLVFQIVLAENETAQARWGGVRKTQGELLRTAVALQEHVEGTGKTPGAALQSTKKPRLTRRTGARVSKPRRSRPKRTEPTEREKEAVNLRTRGFTLQQAGDSMGITGERVRQLLNSAAKRLRPSGRSVSTQALPTDKNGQLTMVVNRGKKWTED